MHRADWAEPLDVVRVPADVRPRSERDVHDVLFSVVAVYLAQIIVNEAIEGHISTARSWLATVAIGALALFAAWRAWHLWRRVSQGRGAESN